jgi:hypothetical protein
MRSPILGFCWQAVKLEHPNGVRTARDRRPTLGSREGVDRSGELRKTGDLGLIDISILGAHRWGVARGVLVSGTDNLSIRFGPIVHGRHESNFKLLILLSARDGTHVAGSLPLGARIISVG